MSLVMLVVKIDRVLLLVRIVKLGDVSGIVYRERSSLCSFL